MVNYYGGQSAKEVLWSKEILWVVIFPLFQ
jgi:hypothetical protein